MNSPDDGHVAQARLDVEDAQAAIINLARAMDRRDQLHEEVRVLTNKLLTARRRLKEAGWDVQLYTSAARKAMAKGGSIDGRGQVDDGSRPALDAPPADGLPADATPPPDGAGAPGGRRPRGGRGDKPAARRCRGAPAAGKEGEGLTQEERGR